MNRLACATIVAFLGCFAVGYCETTFALGGIALLLLAVALFFLTRGVPRTMSDDGFVATMAGLPLAGLAGRTAQHHDYSLSGLVLATAIVLCAVSLLAAKRGEKESSNDAKHKGGTT